MKQTAKALYYKAIDQVASNKAKAQLQKDKAAKNKEKAIEEMITLKPSELFIKTNDD